MPFAFTEQGIAMLSSVLNSEKAIAINISIIRAFVTMRQFTLSYSELKERIIAIESQCASPVRLYRLESRHLQSIKLFS
jgi:hypothetical protein